MASERPVPRLCEGCGKPGGTTPIARHGYCHLRCWCKATVEQRSAIAILVEDRWRRENNRAPLSCTKGGK